MNTKVNAQPISVFVRIRVIRGMLFRPRGKSSRGSATYLTNEHGGGSWLERREVEKPDDGVVVEVGQELSVG